MSHKWYDTSCPDPNAKAYTPHYFTLGYDALWYYKNSHVKAA